MKQRPHRILLVEDEALIAMAEKQQLAHVGYVVDHVLTGEAAIASALDADSRPDLILMDIDLGKGIDGTEAARRILNEVDIPVVFLSSHTEPEVVEKTEKITSYGYVVKNSVITVLDASIKMALRLFDARMKQKEHEEKLQFQATILDRIGDYVTATDLDGRIVYVNEAECALFGKHRDAIIGQTTAIFGEDSRCGATQSEIVETTINEGSWRGDVINFDKNNNRTVMDCRTWSMRDGNGVAHTLVGIATDVTEHKKIQDTLKRSEEEFRSLFETMSTGIVYHSADGTIVSANPAAEKILGLTMDQMNGKTSMDPRWKMVDEEGNDVPVPEHPAMITLRTGKRVGPVDRAVFIPERDEYVWLSVTAIPFFVTGNAKPYQVYVTFEDITERRHAEDALRDSRELFLSSIEALSYPFAVINANTYEIELANTAFGGQSAVGRKCYRALYDSETPCNDPMHPCPINLLRENSRPATVHHEYYNEQGECRYVEISTYPIFDGDGQLIRIAESRIDITERKLAEEEIQRQLAEKETLLNEVHHRIKNNMAQIESLLVLQADSADSAEVRSALHEATSRVRTTRALYEKLLIGADYEKISMKEYLESVIDSIVEVFNDRPGVTVEKRIDDFMLNSKKTIPVGIILNELLTNVFKYAFRGRDAGHVFIELQRRDTSVTLTVQDDGVGLNEHVAANTSTGFGTTIVTMLSEQLEGSFTIESDNGTRSVVTFDV